MVIGKIVILVAGNKRYKNKIKLKLFQILLDSGATNYVVLPHLVSYLKRRILR